MMLLVRTDPREALKNAKKLAEVPSLRREAETTMWAMLRDQEGPVAETTVEVIDADLYRNYAAFINHAETPNAELRTYIPCPGSPAFIAVFILKKISPGEEITVSYGGLLEKLKQNGSDLKIPVRADPWEGTFYANITFDEHQKSDDTYRKYKFLCRDAAQDKQRWGEIVELKKAYRSGRRGQRIDIGYGLYAKKCIKKSSPGMPWMLYNGVRRFLSRTYDFSYSMYMAEVDTS